MGYDVRGGGRIFSDGEVTEEQISAIEKLSEDYELDSVMTMMHYDDFMLIYNGKYHEEDLRRVLRAITEKCTIKKGEIKFKGEDGSQWRFVYDNDDGRWHKERAEFTYVRVN